MGRQSTIGHNGGINCGGVAIRSNRGAFSGGVTFDGRRTLRYGVCVPGVRRVVKLSFGMIVCGHVFAGEHADRRDAHGRCQPLERLFSVVAERRDRAPKFARRSEALFGLFGQGTQNQGFEFCRDLEARPGKTKRQRLFEYLSFERSAHRVRGERRLPGEHLVHEQADDVEVGALIGLLALRLLGRKVLRKSQIPVWVGSGGFDRVGYRIKKVLVRVCNNDASSGYPLRKQHFARRETTVRRAGAVQLLQRVKETAGDRTGLIRSKRTGRLQNGSQ